MIPVDPQIRAGYAGLTPPPPLAKPLADTDVAETTAMAPPPAPTPAPPPSSPPLLAPPPQSDQSIAGLFKGMAGAITQSLYQSMFDRMLQGKLPEPFPEDKLPPSSKAVWDAYKQGQIKTVDDVRRIATSVYAPKPLAPSAGPPDAAPILPAPSVIPAPRAPAPGSPPPAPPATPVGTPPTQPPARPLPTMDYLRDHPALWRSMSETGADNSPPRLPPHMRKPQTQLDVGEPPQDPPKTQWEMDANEPQPPKPGELPSMDYLQKRPALWRSMSETGADGAPPRLPAHMRKPQTQLDVGEPPGSAPPFQTMPGADVSTAPGERPLQPPSQGMPEMLGGSPADSRGSTPGLGGEGITTALTQMAEAVRENTRAVMELSRHLQQSALGKGEGGTEAERTRVDQPDRVPNRRGRKSWQLLDSGGFFAPQGTGAPVLPHQEAINIGTGFFSTIGGLIFNFDVPINVTTERLFGMAGAAITGR